MKKTVLFYIAIIAVILYFTGITIESHILKLITKPVPILVFLLFLKPADKYRKFIFAGLLLSVTGDVFLEISPSMFIFGLSSFLLAHVAYIIAFVSRSKKTELNALILTLLYGIAVYYFLYPYLGNMSIPVLFYLVVILIMAWRSFAQRSYGTYALYATVGAIFFVFSDSVLAIDKFYTAIPYARWLIMISYWTAQTLIFYSAYKSKQ